jgi:diaminohydroxyphosphoribosylaminopyrimidine deaminase/5-amino-6-(5-phosphoribosylamino)uracil reductase
LVILAVLNDESYIERCLELAAKGKGQVSPNPMVGCVLVKNHVIIGEGYHHVFGGAHAEVEAVNSVKNKADILGATAYVSLEPCAHHGKTPPCAHLLIKAGVSKVVICNEDPFEEVDGKGIQILREAGVEVLTGLLSGKGRELNKDFFTFHEQKRPYVVLKWAQSSDGFIAPEAQELGRNFQISSDFSNQHTHQLRTEVDGIMIGKHTLIKDNPSLNSRHFSGKSPIKIMLDSNLESLEIIKKIYHDQGQTIVLNLNETREVNTSIRLISCDMSAKSILKKLHEHMIMSVLIEGGRQVLQRFIDENCWDEAIQIIGLAEIKAGIKSPVISKYTRQKETKGSTDRITHYFNA